MNMKEIAAQMKKKAPAMAASSLQMRNTALEMIAQKLLANREKIFAANRIDLEQARENNVAVQVIKRLKFDEGKLQGVVDGMMQLVNLPDPIGKSLLKRQLDEGLVMERISVPIGVIGVIFEARPDALVQISALCIKSGNAAILKGGKETANTNAVLFELIHAAAVQAALPEECLYLAQSHSEIDELLACEKSVDLLIPRGSNKFVQYIMEHTNIPVMGHADGVCHIYVDSAADQEMALRVITDAKTQYTVACNAVETILVARCIAKEFLPKLKAAMDAVHVSINGTDETAGIIACDGIENEVFHKEYGDLMMTVKIVEDVHEAAEHINQYGSHHTDAIMTKDDGAAAYFMQMVDSAGVYRNCSTRFADGFRYGFGAEVGISTSKLHARGPVGLEGLTTYKYTIAGCGQIVGEYASGEKQFHFQNL